MEGKGPEAYLFLDAKGNPYSDTPWAFRFVVTKLGFNKDVADPLNKVCFHTLRHTFGSWLAESGVDLYTIGKLMGHKTASMTARYAHLGPNKLRNAAAQLENIQDAAVESATVSVFL
jgi:integrase